MTEQILDFDAIFNTYMAQNQKVWVHDRSTTVGASEVFDCLRKIWFEKLGKKHGFTKDEDDEAWGGMERGNILENHFLVPGITAGLPKGMSLLMAGDDQKTLVEDKASSTPDGLITGLDPKLPLIVRAGERVIQIDNLNSDCVVLEFKSVDPRITLEEEKARHFGQVNVQIGNIRAKTKWKPTHAIILYVNASFVDHLTPFVIEYDENIYKQGKHRAGSIWDIDDPLKIYPEGKMDGSCKHCWWKKACGEAVVNAIPKKEIEIDPLDLTIVDTAVDEYLTAKNEKAEAERRFETAKESIKEVMTDIGTKKVRNDRYSISWYSQKGKKIVDTKAMAADGIDLEPYTREGAPFDQLRVTLRSDEANE